VNTYCTSDLCRPRGRARPPSDSCDRRAFVLTRSGAGVDIPGFGRGRSDMSDREDNDPAARGALGVAGAALPTAMTVIIAVGSAARATAESTTSSRSVILVIGHVAAGVSKAGKVDAGPAACDSKFSPGT
jgi:hypothetical protein